MPRITKKQARELGILPGQKKNKNKQPTTNITQAQWDAKVWPGEVIITIPGEMPSLNQWSRWHWAKQKREKDELNNNLWLLAIALEVPVFEHPQVKVTYYFRASRRRDKDNFAPKWILDALQVAGIIKDDNSKVLELLPVEFEVDQVSPRVEVWIKER